MTRFSPWLALLLVMPCGVAFGQQTGTISGEVTTADGDAIPGVVVEARGDVLPRARTALTKANGDYRFPQLPPGNYQLTFSLDGMTSVTREVRVVLGQTAFIDVAMQPEGVTEALEVFGEAPVIDTTSTELKAAVDDEAIERLPIGQEYQDLVKLIPGVQYTEDDIRGPSAGGSGQDNVYLFDGVNVGVPLFGTLSADPSSHDIEQVSIVKGGAKAIDFNRSGGFLINSVSKSGTDRFKGAVSYQIQTESMTGDRDTGSSEEFEEDQDWAVLSLGGPIAREHLFFYTSYYRPTVQRDGRSNLYGAVPDREEDRDELFAKLTFTPNDSFLLSASYRDSETDERGFGVVEDTHAGTTSNGNDAKLEIGILEGSWLASGSSFLTFKLTDFDNPTQGRPDNLVDFQLALGAPLNIANLDTQGLFQVPLPIEGQDAYNAFIGPIIDQYGYLENGIRNGGGQVGFDSTLDDIDFLRESYQVGYDHLIGRHDLHFGYQWYRDEEILQRRSNGWGRIEVPGGRITFDGQPVFYQARFWQQSLEATVPAINSAFESQSIEINDTIRWDDWTFNVGVVMSNDELFGEGLRENPATPSGFELATGNEYKMYEIDWDETISPRLGVTRSLQDGRASAYASYARYYPAASSLPRAASWARNLQREIRAYFDAAGNFIGVDPIRSSSGKFFDEGLTPRSIDEVVLGYSTQLEGGWALKTHARYREGQDFWEDTNNNARSRFEPPPGIPTEDYIPNLNDLRFGPGGIGGSSYVIAELDGAFTKYYEASVEAEYNSGNAFFRGSYVWSHYYGNFDQDNTTTNNDLNIFIGSSFIADGAGRQLWDNRYGDLRGDRRHLLKLYGFYNLKWNASVGAYAIYQSGQPWEEWNVEVYRHLTSSLSDTSRYAEPAGSRTTSDHYQLDLNYTHNFKLGDRYNLQVRADLFNVFDQQTGYNIQNKRNSANFGDPRDFFDPRRFQLMVKFEF